MIEISDVTQHYGTKPILRNLSLKIETGDVVAVLGPNGMGKTTLLKLMAGILSPVGGRILVDGVERRSSVAAEKAIRAKTVFLPDDIWFPARQTVREYVLAVAKLYGRNAIQAMDHADRLFDLFDLGDQANSPVTRCSTGQRKKAALCSALIANAPLMLLDEPFSGGLDPGGIIAMKSLLKRVNELPKDRPGVRDRHAVRDCLRTIVFTTPVPEIIEEVANKIAIIQDGQVLIYGSPETICQSAGETKLEKAIDKLLHTDTLDRVQRYFAGVGDV